VGHTSAAGPPQVTEGMTITEKEAWHIFARDTDLFEAVVNDAITVPMEPHHFDAFVSICHNIGEVQFRSATFVERYNAGDVDGCAEAILWWDQPSEIIPRRQGNTCSSGTVCRTSLGSTQSPRLTERSSHELERHHPRADQHRHRHCRSGVGRRGRCLGHGTCCSFRFRLRCSACISPSWR
jgi:GH24 family phage-related lysozyme (muramidase)